MAATLGSGRCCLLRGHGSVIVCDSIPEVFLDSLEMEENARSVINAAVLGPLKPITPEEVVRLKPSFDKNGYRIAKTWGLSGQGAAGRGALRQADNGGSRAATAAISPQRRNLLKMMEFGCGRLE